MYRVHVVLEDITKIQVDAIVNAANERMLGGGGVDGAIHRAAGPDLLEECLRIPEITPGVRCPAGSARVTGGYNLNVKKIIHTVGPVWSGGSKYEDNTLAMCYYNCFIAMREYDLVSIAFPAISCGVYGFPPERAANIAANSIYNNIRHTPGLQSVYLVAFQPEMVDILSKAINKFRLTY